MLSFFLEVSAQSLSDNRELKDLSITKMSMFVKKALKGSEDGAEMRNVLARKDEVNHLPL